MSIAVLINAHSRRGSDALGDRIRSLLPTATVRVTRSAAEAGAWIGDELSRTPPRIFLAGGGDGTAVSVMNFLREHALAVEAVGLLPFGTGNAWARSTSELGLNAVLGGIAELGRTASPPIRKCALVEVEGRLTPFAGVGWDAEVLADHAAWRSSNPFLANLGGPAFGYARSLLGRTLPRGVRQEPARVRVINLGEPALTVDREGVVHRVADGGVGAVLYEGPFGVGGASTTEELGLGFRAFKFAREAENRIAVRIYAATPMQAMLGLPKLWRGGYPAKDDYRFLLTHCRFEFDRPVPYETGGDLAGERTHLEFEACPDAVRLIDFRALAPGHGK